MVLLNFSILTSNKARMTCWRTLKGSENESLWKELSELRAKHAKQQQVIRKPLSASAEVENPRYIPAVSTVEEAINNTKFPFNGKENIIPFLLVNGNCQSVCKLLRLAWNPWN
ncbi:uncharacterized protein ACOB7L_018402 isoform 1-T2 [Callospermophilus lateralis]